MFKKWISSNYRKVNALQEQLTKIEGQLNSLVYKMEQGVIQPPVKVENIHVDHISLDKLEFNNNFKQLEVNELTGKLNIGANYSDLKTTSENDCHDDHKSNQKDELQVTKENTQKTKGNHTSQPEVNIRAKKKKYKQ
ncbi:hypothetical protein [Longirhabdus pacifica]|uniref:hypothetical protein n=1 Tax=Longirhabdus pacifica TaxID=2305227 RepID=UPI001008C859|nr:hypothetical protein [Longirhabdus pacifica]